MLSLICGWIMGRRHAQLVHSTPAEFGLEGEAIHFVTNDGLRLEGWWIPSQNSTRTVIFLHGYIGSCDPDLKYAPEFHRRGFNVLVFNFRNHANSQGRFTTIGALERRDCAAAIEFVRQKGSQVIGLLGFSMGGRVALLTAPGMVEVKAVISDCGPLNLATTTAAEFHQQGCPAFLGICFGFFARIGMSLISGENLFVWEPCKKARALAGIPVLLIAGGNDPYTRPDELAAMQADAGPSLTIWSVSEAGHRTVEDFRPEEYTLQVVLFFERWLVD